MSSVGTFQVKGGRYGVIILLLISYVSRFSYCFSRRNLHYLIDKSENPVYRLKNNFLQILIFLFLKGDQGGFYQQC